MHIKKAQGTVMLDGSLRANTHFVLRLTNIATFMSRVSQMSKKNIMYILYILTS